MAVAFEAVVLAGGKGTRLEPFTHVLPKPLLPINERPILDVVLGCLARDGCRRVTLAVGHLGHLIELYCGSGERWSLQIEYFREEVPLGTVGALAEIQPRPSAPFVVMNGDVLCDISFTELLAAHRASGAELTIASFRRRLREELGILELDGGDRLVAYHEKPEHEYLVSTGIYVFEPTALGAIPCRPMDFPDLVQALLAEGRAVRSHLHEGYWLDLGRPDDFARANREFGQIRPKLGIQAQGR
jgi:mannose-1-phosphate guanylyltransferase